MKNIIESDGKIVWEDLMGSEANIKHLFRSIGIDNYELRNIRSRYVIDNIRHGVIVTVEKKYNKNLAKIIIDAKQGNPTWMQLKDVTFNLGADCDHKIVLYDDSIVVHTDYDHDFDDIIAIGFAKINNYYNVPTHLVKVSHCTDKISDRVFKYHLEECDAIGSKTNNNKVHSKENFDEAEFWILYDYITNEEPYRYKEPQFWLSNDKGKMPGGIDFLFDWDQKGWFVHVTVYSDEGAKKLKWLCENHYYEIHRKIKDWEVNIKKESDTIYKISMKMSNQPFSDFVHATSDEKRSYIEKIHKKEKDLLGYYDDIIEYMPREF